MSCINNVVLLSLFSPLLQFRNSKPFHMIDCTYLILTFVASNLTFDDNAVVLLTDNSGIHFSQPISIDVFNTYI